MDKKNQTISGLKEAGINSANRAKGCPLDGIYEFLVMKSSCITCHFYQVKMLLSYCWPVRYRREEVITSTRHHLIDLCCWMPLKWLCGYLDCDSGKGRGANSDYSAPGLHKNTLLAIL
jgi:hypothetical protein